MIPLVSDPGMHHGTCVMHVTRCLSGSLTRGDRGKVPGIPGAYATRNFMFLARGPLADTLMTTKLDMVGIIDFGCLFCIFGDVILNYQRDLKTIWGNSMVHHLHTGHGTGFYSIQTKLFFSLLMPVLHCRCQYEFRVYLKSEFKPDHHCTCRWSSTMFGTGS